MQPTDDQLLAAKRIFMSQVQRWLDEGRFRSYPKTKEDYERLSVGQIEQLEEISPESHLGVTQAFDVYSDQVLNELAPETLGLIGDQLEQVLIFVQVEDAYYSDTANCLGMTRELKDGFCIAVALNVGNIVRNRFSIASTLFHETVHVATWFDLKVDIPEYFAVYEAYYQETGLDSFTDFGRNSQRECMVRILQGALFGIQEYTLSKEEFEAGVRSWQLWYPDMLELAIRDQFLILSETAHEKVEVKEMQQQSRTIRMVPEELLRMTKVICWDGYPVKFKDPIKRGTVLWLREQAKLAENDPDREWLGLRHEFDLLLSGAHPDPHPERIILGKDADDFDPSELEDPEGIISLSDNSAFNNASGKELAEWLGFPAKSQQFLASLSRRELDRILGIKED